MTANRTIRLKAMLLALFLMAFMGGPASAVEYWLVAGQTTVSMPDNQVVTVWGFGEETDGDFTTVEATVTLPGPWLRVDASDPVLTIHLLNNLPEPVSLHILGQMFASAPVPVIPDGRVMSFSHETAPGATGTYTWGTAGKPFRPGTYMVQSGTNPAKQVQMGLYAPVTKDAVAAGVDPAQAYAGVPYDKELLFVFHAIDPDIHRAVALNDYGPGKGLTSSNYYHPRYFLINGATYPDPKGDPYNEGTAINTGDRVLLRIVNAGLETHAPCIQGMHMTLWAEDGLKLNHPRKLVSHELAAAKTMDAVIEPAAQGKFPLHDGRLNLNNAGSPAGGMLTYLNVGVDPVTVFEAIYDPAPANMVTVRAFGRPGQTLSAAVTLSDDTIYQAPMNYKPYKSPPFYVAFIDTSGSAGVAPAGGNSLMVSSNGGGYDVKPVPFPKPDTVDILRARYRANNGGRVIVTAVSSAPVGAVTLWAKLFYTDTTSTNKKVMTYLPPPKGYYRFIFKNIDGTGKTPDYVVVTSSLGGSAQQAVEGVVP